MFGLIPTGDGSFVHGGVSAPEYKLWAQVEGLVAELEDIDSSETKAGRNFLEHDGYKAKAKRLEGLESELKRLGALD